jgi:signal transduction histidine kinase
MQRILFFFLFVFISCGKIFSQYPKRFHTSYYTTDNGLPSNGIKGLQWDEQNGFLWIATEAGVSRFNGLDFKNFTIENTPFIESERMLFIVKNNQGKIYAADQSGNILSVKKNTLLLHRKSINVQQQSFNKRFTISISDTFFNNQSVFKSSWPFNLLYNSILPTSDTSAYIIHSKNIYKFSMGMTDATAYPDASLIANSGFKLSDKCFIAGKDAGIIELYDNPSRNRPVFLINEDGSKFRFLDKNSRIFWVNGMDNPVLINKNRAWLLFLSGNKISASPICDEIPTDALIEYVQYSRAKEILFLGTDSKGIIVLSQNRVDAMKTTPAGFNERNAYYSQVALDDGNVLTNEGHIIGKNISSSASLPIKGKFNYLTSLTGDSLLWYSQHNAAAGYTCLYRYNYKTRQTEIYPKVRCAEIVIYEMKNGRLLAVTEFGIAWFSRDSLHYLYRHRELTYNSASYKVEETGPGIVLLATCSGILQFNTDSKKLDTLLKSTGYCIRSTWKYGDYIFFGTYGKGFFVWKNRVLKPMPLDKRKYLLYTHCFIPDDDGYCWISTNRGLFKANIDELISAYENNSAVVYYHYFGKSDGMDMMEMNGGCTPCALQLKNKTLSFPTMDGLLWVNPEKAKLILPEGEIFIDKITADSTDISSDLSAQIILPANTKEITIKPAFSAWCNKENVYLEYQLNDTLNWKPVNTDNDVMIQFSNLSPGEYTLRFRKLNGFGINNYSYKTILFRITTPWYKMWWFTISILVAAAGLFMLYVRMRTRQLKQNQLRLEKLVAEKTKELQEKNEVLEKNDSIKTRLISIISHDIITPLKFLTAAGKNLIEKRKLMPEELRDETIKEMTGTSQDLHLLTTNILNWIKYQNENRRLAKENFCLHGLVNQVTGVLGSLARQKEVSLVNNIDEDFMLYQYYEPLKIVIYNLVSNAINFTEKGKVSISSKTGNDNVTILVTDDGVGMTPEQIQNILADQFIISSVNIDKRKGNGLGYLIIKDLLKAVGGSFSIQSEKGKGTVVSVSVNPDPK